METFQKRLNKSSQRIATCSALQKPPGGGGVGEGARKEWSRDAKVLLPGMLDKLKDKTSAVIVALQSALDESIKYCFELGEAVDEACGVVAQSSQSSSRNAQMAREDVRRHESCLHKRLTQVYRTAHREVHERVESRRAKRALDARRVCKASGGMKAIDFLLMDLDQGKKSKIAELLSATPQTTAAATTTTTTKAAAMTNPPSRKPSASVKLRRVCEVASKSKSARNESIRCHL